MYLVAKYCMNNPKNVVVSNRIHRKMESKIPLIGFENVKAFWSFAIISIVITMVALGPFVINTAATTSTNIIQSFPIYGMINRLFPFGRGLVHDYFAANAWSVYVTLDKVLSSILRIANQAVVADTRSNASMRVLPEISPLISMICYLVVSNSFQFSYLSECLLSIYFERRKEDGNRISI